MTSDKYAIDSHKLFYHVDQVYDWLHHKIIYPIYMEISPTGACNHRCVFCSVDFMGYQKRALDTDILKTRLQEMGRLGVKSIMYAGEGEPFLHKDLAELILHTKQSGIDVAITTNAVLMKPDILEMILGVTQWIKVSCNAGTAETYGKIHQCHSKDFERVLANLRYAVQLKKTHQYACTLGMQILLIPENVHEVERLANISRDIGLDYLVVKPYTHHVRNMHKYEIRYEEYADMLETLSLLNTEDFSIIFRRRAMQKWDQKQRKYSRCLALPFWSYIDAGGNVWGCSAHLGDNRFLYGNIHSQCFQEIWEGEKRQQSLDWVEQDFQLDLCKLNCRMDEVNNYLWQLQHPPAHKNFI